jgi:hypothetical protein
MKVEVFGSYLQSQAALPQTDREPQPLAIKVGAGGIAELLGQRLTAAEKTPATSPWAVFDANLAKHVLEDHKLPAKLEQFMTEDARLLPVEAIVPSSGELDARATHDPNHPSIGWLRPDDSGRAGRQRHHREAPKRVSRATGGTGSDANSA